MRFHLTHLWFVTFVIACSPSRIPEKPVPQKIELKPGTELVCAGLWTPPTPVACIDEGAKCNDKNPCTYNDACRNGMCSGVPEIYCTPCRNAADCCGKGHFTHCLRPFTRAAIVPQDERTACVEGQCLMVTVEHHASCERLPVHASEG